MKERGLSGQDLALALAISQATKTGILESEGHIIDENMHKNLKNDSQTKEE